MTDTPDPILRTPAWYLKWIFASVLLTIVVIGGLFALATPLAGGLLFDWWFSPMGGIATLVVVGAVGAWLWPRLLG